MQFTQVLDQLGIAYKQVGEDHHARQGWVQIECPWCGKGTGKHHFGFSLSHGNGNCYKCGRHRTGDTLSEATGRSLRYCLDLLRGFTRLGKPDRTKALGRLSIPPNVGSMLPAHLQYLRKRGFDPQETARLWDVQGIGISAELSWRLYIPIHLHGKVVSWTTRAVGRFGKRYVSASSHDEIVSHKSILYGGDYVRNVAIVCEGPTDVWRIGPGAVATLGLNYTPSQELELGKIPVRVICFDREKEAQKRAHRLARLLAAMPGETVVASLESGEDVASADLSEIAEFREQWLRV